MKTRSKISLEQRFWDKVNVKSDDECWEWMGAKCPKGYGTFRINKQKIIKVHRLVWDMTYGNIPNDLHVLHHCDNPSCVNPKHLFLGTNQDNVNDKILKGRQPTFIGMKNSCAKLTDEDVRKIRDLYVPRELSQYKLAKMFGVSRGTISHVLDYSTWSHVK